MRISLICAIILASALNAVAAHQDPTRPSQAFADTVRGRIGGLDALKIRALVVGSEAEGVALVGSSDFTGAPLRQGSIINQNVGGVNVPLSVDSVTAEGVKIKTSNAEGGEFFLPGSFRPLPKDNDSKLIRYIEFSGVPLRVALRLISDQTGVNISVSEPTSSRLVSIFLRNVTPEMAVEEICRATGLWYRRDALSGIIRVTTMEEYEQSLATFREEQTETYTLLYPNVIEVASIIYGLYPERVMLSLGENELLEDEESDISRRIERFNKIADSGGSSFLKLEPNSASGSGGSTSSGVLTFNDGRVSVVPPVGTGFSQGDAKRLSEAEAAGTNQFDSTYSLYRARTANIFVTVSRKNSMLMVRTSDSKAMDDIRALIRRLDVPTPMVLLEVKVLELQLDDGFTSSFEYQFAKDYNTTSEDSQQNVTAGFPGFNPLASQGRNDSMSFQILSKHLQARIQMLEEEGRAKTLATPMLLTANNEVSRLFIGEERPMVKNITSQTIANGDTSIVVPQTEIEFQSVGTMLFLTPNINADRTVTLRLLQENSEINKNAATIPIYGTTDGGVVQNVPIDVISSRSVTGTFVAKDEMTVAIGGLIKEVEVERQSRVPVLGRIPLLGWFFRSTEKVKERTELIVLVKPHVISTPSDGEGVSRRVLDATSIHPARHGESTLNILKDSGKASEGDKE